MECGGAPNCGSYQSKERSGDSLTHGCGNVVPSGHLSLAQLYKIVIKNVLSSSVHIKQFASWLHNTY